MAAARATALVMVGRGAFDGTIAFDDRFHFTFFAAISQTKLSVSATVIYNVRHFRHNVHTHYA